MKYFLWLLLISFSILDAQEELSVQHVLYVPQVFYVGDTVELRAQIRVPQGREIPSVPYYEQPSWGKIVSIEITPLPQNIELRIAFISYESGTLALPLIVLDDMIISGLSVYVPSILDVTQAELTEAASQLLLPHTVMLIILIVGVIAAIPVFCMMLWRIFHRYLHRLRRWHAVRRPFYTCKRRFSKLHQQTPELEEKDFYFTLTHTIRNYLVERISPHFLSATSKEIGELLLQSKVSSSLSSTLEALFHSGDLVKFAHVPVSMEIRNRHLGTAQQLIQGLQKDLDQKKHDHS